MRRKLTPIEQDKTLELVWYFTQDLESKCLKNKNKKQRTFVTELYNFLNRLDYTRCRPDWEVLEDPRQKKFDFIK